MHDDTTPHDDETTPVPAANFDGRTAGRASAIRAGVVLGAALVVALGTAVVMGASASPSTPTVGADPSATTSGSAAPAASPKTDDGDKQDDQGNGKFKDKGFGRGSVGFGKITVTNVSGSKVSLATDDGWTRTITVTADTKITKGGEPATIGEVKVGDVVRIGQKKNADGTYTVTRLAIILPQASGTVTAIDAATLTIKGRGNTLQVIATNGATTYHLGKTAGARSDVKVGSKVVVVGERATNGNLTAASVTVILPVVGGTVATVSGNTITIGRRDGTKLTVHVDADTAIGVAGVDKATVSDVKAGMAIVVQGQQRADGSLDATSVRAGQFKKDRGPDSKAPKPSASAAPSAGTS